ncbi:MAG: hypothetical protein RIS56_1463 [Verrucomicrobiota bacterium]|jgi:hypothetical protein
MTFPSIRLEGAILTADLLDAIAREDKHSQKPADFGLDPSTKVKDEIASTWASAKALWTGYQAKIAALHEGQSGVSETRNLFIIPLLALLGYQPEKTEAETVNGKSYAISHRDISRDGFPLHIMGWHDSLEKKRDSGGPRISSHALVQEYLNLTEHSYGLITNGRQLRLLRDSSRLIKLSFLEFDLNRIFEEDLYADFAILFRLLHATRMPANRAHASGSVIEKYHQESVDSGSRIRDGLAAAVAYSMQTVANGLLAHPANTSLVEQLRKEPARANELHQNLLRWVYRTLFVLVIEERVLHHAPTATLRQRQLYRDYYSLQRLRRLADRPQLADRLAHDLWRAMHQTLRLYEDGGKGLPLGIAPLGSFLFREEGLQHLFQYQLDNRSLLQTLNRLSTFTHPDTNVRMRVNYGALDVEEFGSVYESLLELRPRIIPEGEKLTFSYAQLAGNERKTTGSYYTPDSLVQCLLDSALDPVIEERLAGKKGPEAEKALLSIKVCDKAVGSGHFLIGAAHRLARRLAEIRAGEEALSPDVQRHALRDVVSHCLYGVDINPLSVELCKVSLWMLAMEPGKPLSFLDHHIRCGNSLLGATPGLIKGGIPDEAFQAIEGDDKEACAALKKQNKRENPKLGEWFVKDEADIRNKLFQAATAIDDMADSRPEDIQRKEAAFRNAQSNYDFQKAWDLANLWCAAFVIKKQFPVSASESSNLKSEVTASLESQPLVTQGGLFGGTEELPKTKGTKAKTPSRAGLEIPIGITTQHLRDFVEGGALPHGLLAEVKRLADQYQFFHFHLAFPEVFAQGGFDVSLSNPPWEHTELKEKEWFAERRPEIANAATGAKRKAIIESLKQEDPLLWTQFEAALRQHDGASHFLGNSGRFPFCGRGRINHFAVFAELMRSLLNPDGQMGAVLPTGIATDDTTKFFFQDIVSRKSLVSLYDFSNTEELFLGVDRNAKFCLFTATRGGGKITEVARFAFAAVQANELSMPEKVFALSPDDILLLNPNTHTCPVFRSVKDAEITKMVYRRIPIFVTEGKVDGDKWGVSFSQGLFNTTTDSHLFVSIDSLKQSALAVHGNRYRTGSDTFYPLYEGKMIQSFDHRYANSLAPETGARIRGKSEHLEESEKQDPTTVVYSRHYVKESDCISKKPSNWNHAWFLGWRAVGGAVANVRTLVCSAVPFGGVADKIFILYPSTSAKSAAVLAGCMNSFALDYCVRQKISGLTLNYFIIKQLPILPPSAFEGMCSWSAGTQTLLDWLLPRVLELTYTAWDLEAFAQDCGWSGPPFRWDEERRSLLRCELDAAFFHLYLGTEAEWSKQPEALTKAFPTPRHAVAYILDTFPIVKRKDEARTAEKNTAGEVVKPGRYLTKDTILEIYDALQASIRTGTPYQTRLNPPPADARCCHPPKQ